MGIIDRHALAMQKANPGLREGSQSGEESTAMKRLTSFFTAMDKDKSGQITMEEFKAVLTDMGHVTVEELEVSFRKFDDNNSGDICVDEICEICREVSTLHPTKDAESIMVHTIHYVVETVREETLEQLESDGCEEDPIDKAASRALDGV